FISFTLCPLRSHLPTIQCPQSSRPMLRSTSIVTRSMRLLDSSCRICCSRDRKILCNSWLTGSTTEATRGGLLSWDRLGTTSVASAILWSLERRPRAMVTKLCISKATRSAAESRIPHLLKPTGR
ncbi:hypothetical protein FOZ63_021487, partial [Perkinsus olseni]